MAKQFTIPFKSFYDTDCTIDIYVDGYSGAVEELKAGIMPFVVENSRSSVVSGANGLVETFFKINAISSTDLNNTALQSEEYGDIWFEYKEETVLKYKGVISPFETGSPYEGDGYYTLGIGAEIGLNELKSKELRNTDGSILEGRIRLIDVVSLALKSLTLPNTFNIKSFVSIQTFTGATEVGADTDFFSRYVDAETFKIGLNEWMSCYEALETVLSGKFDLYFDEECWVLDYPLNSLASTRNVAVYDADGVFDSRTNVTISKPEIDNTKVKRGGNEGRVFSKKNITIDHKINSIVNKITNPNFEFDGFDILNWTSTVGSLEIGGYGTQSEPFYVKIGGSVYSKTTPTDTEYIESTPFDWYPVGRSDFADRELSTYYDEDEKLSFNIKGEYGSGISGARIQIIATYEKIRANQPQSTINDPTPTIIYDSKTIYYTNEGWSSEPAWYITGRGAIEEIQVSPPPLRFTSTLSYKALPYVRYDVPTPTAVSVKLRLFRGDRKKIGEATTEVGGYTYFSKFFSASASTWLLSDENKLKGGQYEYVTSKKTDRDSGVSIPISMYEKVSPFAFGSIYVDDSTTTPIDGFKRLGEATVLGWLDFVASDFLRANDIRLINLDLPFMDTFYPSQLFVYESRLFRVHDFEKDVAMDSTRVTLHEVRYSSSAVSLKISDREFTEVIKEARPQRYNDLTTDDNIFNKGGRIGLNDRLEALSQINSEGEGLVFGDAIKSNAGILYLQKEGKEDNTGIFWTDSLNETTDFFKPSTDGFTFKSEANPYEVILDFSQLTANTRLIIPPLSADAYILTSENGWVLEGNNLLIPKKLGSTTNIDWTIVHNNNTIGTIKSTGINFGDLRLDTGAIQFNTSTAQSSAIGKMLWESDFNTLQLGLTASTHVHFGQDDWWWCKAAQAITKGDVLYASGAVGASGKIEVSKFIANGTIDENRIIGIASETASSGSFFPVIMRGALSGINTSSYSAGTILYASSTTAGALTSTEPTAPNKKLPIAFVAASHANNGEIYIRSYQQGLTLGKLHDVNLSSVVDKNVLSYNNANSRWENSTLSDLGLASGTGTVNYVTKWANTTGGLVNSQIFDNGTNVGIGTTSPANKLHVVSASSTIAMIESSASQAFYGLKSNAGGVVYFGNNNGGDFTIQTAGSGYSDKLYITSAGNVGIGTTSPSHPLSIDNTNPYALGVYRKLNVESVGDAGTLITMGAYSSGIAKGGTELLGILKSDAINGSLRLRTLQSGVMVDDIVINNGNIGIGTASPSGIGKTLNLYGGSSTNSYLVLEGDNGGNFLSILSSATSGDASSIISKDGFRFAIASAKNLTGYSEKMRITSAGNVGIGTTTPSEKLHVNGTTRTTNLMITNGAAVGKVWQCNNTDGTGAWVTPLASERYIGEWAANSGTAPSASPTAGDYWVVNTAGTYLGIAYVAGDEIYWNGTAWLKRSNFLTLPIATTSTLGGIKIGSNLAIDGGGVVTVASSPILTTTRNIAITGDITWNVNFNGSADVTGVGTLATVNSNVGTFRSVTVNAKGLVTAATNPTTLAGFGITDAWTKTESDGRYLYADNKTSFIATTSQLGLIAVGTTLEISGFGVLNQKSGIVTTGTYRSVTVDTYGRVTSGTNPTTLSGYGITNAYTKTESDVNYVSQSVIYSYPSWLAAIDWSIITGKPSSFTPSAHTLDSHSNVTITSNTNGEILRWNGTAWINNTLAEAGIQPAGAYLTGNQTITLSGIITGSGTTAITTAIADNALSIAKTSGLQTALNGKQNQLNGVGFVKANGTTITYDNSTYLTSVSLANTQIGFGNGSNVLSSTASFTYSNNQIHLYGGTGAFNIGKGGIDNEYWIDAASTNLNLYGSRIVSRNNHQFNNGIYAGGTLGSSGQVLSSTGSGVQWITPAAGASLNNTYIGFGNGSNLLSGSSSFTYVDNQIRMYGGTGAFNIGKGGFDNEYWVDAASANLNLYGYTIVARANFQFNAGLRAGGSYGSSGQILSSTGSGVQWINAPSGGSNLNLTQTAELTGGNFFSYLINAEGSYQLSKSGQQVLAGLWIDGNNVQLNSFDGSFGASELVLQGGTSIKLTTWSSYGYADIVPNEIRLSGTRFKVNLADSWGGYYSPSGGDKVLLTYDSSKGAFVLQRINTYNTGGITYLTL